MNLNTEPSKASLIQTSLEIERYLILQPPTNPISFPSTSPVPINPVYKFPILLSSPSKLFNTKQFSRADLTSLDQSLAFLRSRSPFAVALNNSIDSNVNSLQSRDLLLQIQQAFAYPESSVNSEYSFGDSKLSVPSNDEVCLTSIGRDSQPIVELLAETDDETSFVLDTSLTLDSSTVNRLFLNGFTASKSKLVQSSSTYFNMDSPIVQKLVVCEESSSGPLLESRTCKVPIHKAKIQGVFANSGFLNVPKIEYYGQTQPSKAFIDYSHTQNSLTLLCSAGVIADLLQTQVTLVSCGLEHCVALTSYRKVYSWGCGDAGCLGLGSKQSYKTPALIPSLTGVNYIECGSYHTAVVLDKGELWTWGRNDLQQLGLREELCSSDKFGKLRLHPAKVENLPAVQAVACGEAHTLALSSCGRVFAFGSAEEGQLGVASEVLFHSSDTHIYEVDMPINTKKIAAGAMFSTAITENGRLWAWGNGSYGQLGIGHKTQHSNIPVEVLPLQDELVTDVVCGENSVICMTQSGKIYGWGQGVVGNIGSSFSHGASIVCFLPRELSEVDVAHRFLVRADELEESLLNI